MDKVLDSAYKEGIYLGKRNQRDFWQSYGAGEEIRDLRNDKLSWFSPYNIF
jgi:hypothetical protein